MRKGYVSIEDMGTSRQNPRREEYYEPPHAVPVFQKGRTLIRDIEQQLESNQYHPRQEQPRPDPVPILVQQVKERRVPKTQELSCPDVASHIAKCPLCSKIYNQDLTIYYLIIGVLLAIILALLFRRRYT